jgi:AcrR family transcriptional regulator
MSASRRSNAGRLGQPSVASSADAVSPRVRVSEIQRSRLLRAAVETVDELGYTDSTVAHITRRARVSRRTFYDIFTDREDCLLAVLEYTRELIASELAQLEVLPWRERVRAALWTILCFLDREPALGRVCVVQSVRGGQRVLERREALLTSLAAAVDEGRQQSSRPSECPPLTAEGLIGAALAIVHSRLLKRDIQPLHELLGQLMGMIVLPYLGPAAARRERLRPAPTLRGEHEGASDPRVTQDHLREIPMRLTYRTARVLEDVAEHPGASNRVIAEHAGISDQGQVSKLLARLERLGLLQNIGRGHAQGEPNSWQLTATGLEVAQSLRTQIRYPRQAA